MEKNIKTLIFKKTNKTERKTNKWTNSNIPVAVIGRQKVNSYKLEVTIHSFIVHL